MRVCTLLCMQDLGVYYPWRRIFHSGISCFRTRKRPIPPWKWCSLVGYIVLAPRHSCLSFILYIYFSDVKISYSLRSQIRIASGSNNSF